MIDIKTQCHTKILSHLPSHARILDLGCGNGELLKQIKDRKDGICYGVDLQFSNVISCMKDGISIFQGNINDGLKEFGDNSFDVVILSQTLQEVMDPVFVLNEMTRVGKTGIVTFPNFGYWRVRLNMALTGHSPKTKNLPYEWYNTPNIRVLTIKDFRALCHKESIRITAEESIYSKPWMKTLFSSPWSNLLAQQGLFIVEKGR
tara:strand:+ start:96 stop:707 length:612 start_codon:yes stop_codon:yes gene_type:complete